MIWLLSILYLYICASILTMKNKFIIFIGLLALVSCGRYSQVKEAPQKEELKANTRVYGDFEQPARQSKNTYANPEDANDRSAKIKDFMFGDAKDKKIESVPVSTDSSNASKETKAQAGS